jgi:hypothetical protein
MQKTENPRMMDSPFFRNLYYLFYYKPMTTPSIQVFLISGP